MTIVRRPWSLTSARKESFVIGLPFGPPRPPAPWQPAQFSAYRTGNSRTSFGAGFSEPLRGRPGAESQAESRVMAIPAVAHRYRNEFTGVFLLLEELFLELQFQRAERRTGSRVSAYATAVRRRYLRRCRRPSAKR